METEICTEDSFVSDVFYIFRDAFIAFFLKKQAVVPQNALKKF